MPDMDKVIKGLGICRKYGAIGGRNCNNPYEHTDHRGNCPYGRHVIGCVEELINDVLELLKEQEAKIEQLNRFVNGFSRDAMPVVRCKECKHAEECEIAFYFGKKDDWFCADGEQRG